MKVLVTGSSSGIGLATARKFLKEGFEVVGFDILPSSMVEVNNYTHHIVDVRCPQNFPDIPDVDFLINNAGCLDEENSIGTNLLGLMNMTNKYGLQEHIRAIVNLASASAHTGAEFGAYTASKGGVVSYTKWTAKQIAKYGATCNSISFGGVYTPMNNPVIDNPVLWDKIMDQTPLKRWATSREAAKWIYFVAVENRSMSGQDIVIDNLEMLNHTFVWEE